MSGLTMGSLFDGIGGFPLAAIRSGITPVWASEIEAFPIEVTKQRFPSMIHVGDITKLNGAELPPVDIICGGSPCQDLSVAGARAGLSGARSGLFMEQVRLVKEMRNADDTQEDMDAAIQVIEAEFATWEGCELHSLAYGGDAACSDENIEWLNGLEMKEQTEPFTQCILFSSSFHSPVEQRDAWDADTEYSLCAFGLPK